MSSLLGATPTRLLFRPRDIELISESMKQCKPTLNNITISVQRLHDYLISCGQLSRPPAKFNAFNKGEEMEPRGLLSDSFHTHHHEGYDNCEGRAVSTFSFTPGFDANGPFTGLMAKRLSAFASNERCCAMSSRHQPHIGVHSLAQRTRLRS